MEAIGLEGVWGRNGYGKMSDAVAKLWSSKEGFGIVGWRVINIFLSSDLLLVSPIAQTQLEA